jgi:small subunit ribosomal protein S5
MYKKETTNLITKLICVNKVSKVITGGKKLSFAALVVVGDGKGRIGFGTGKAREITDARNKAIEVATRTMIKVPLKEGRTIHHDCEGKFGSGYVILRTATPGTGIIAGGPMRAIFEVMGIQDVVAKCTGSSNPHNMVRATFNALTSLYSPRTIAAKRGKKVGDIVSRRDGAVAKDAE